MKRFSLPLAVILLLLPGQVMAQGQPPAGQPDDNPDAQAQAEAEAQAQAEAEAEAAKAKAEAEAAKAEAEAAAAEAKAELARVEAEAEAAKAEAAAAAAKAAEAEQAKAELEAKAAEQAARGPKYTASFFTRYENRSGYDTLGVSRTRFLEGDATAYRARLGLTLPNIDLGEDMSATVHVSGQASGFLGDLGGTVADSPLGLYEGYVRVSGKRSTLDFGRLVLNYGDALVIGDLDWHQTARSFDGVRAGFLGRDGQYRIDVFATQLGEGRPLANAAAGDGYFYGAHASLGPLVSSTMALDVYAFGLGYGEVPDVPIDPLDPGAGTATLNGATLGTLGARVKDRRGALDYRLEVGVQTGTSKPGAAGQDNPSTFAFHGDVEVGYNLAGGARIALEGLYASGDDPDTEDNEGWNQLFPTGHKFLGLADVFGERNNVYGGVLHFALPVSKSPMLVLKFDGHVLARPHRVNGSTGYAGTELDFGVIQTLAKGTKLSFLWAEILPAEKIFGTDERASYLEIQLRFDMK